MPEIIIPEILLSQVINHCRECYPNEACGILSGKGNTVQGVHPMTNAEPSPVSYYMEPSEQFSAMKDMRKEGRSMVGIYHSHPQSPAFPSPKDISLAFYSDAVYIIVGLIRRDTPEVRAFTITDGQATDVALMILD